MLVAAAGWGCAEAQTDTGGGGSGAGGTGLAGAGGDGGSAGGSFSTSTDGAGGGVICEYKVEKAQATPLDMIFLLDWSESMQGGSWEGTTEGLSAFFTDPLSAGIQAGMVFLPTIKPLGPEGPCDINLFKTLDVPIAPLPGNAFFLTNIMPENAVGSPTPLAAALPGALMAATAYQDAHPDHKVVVVMTGDGDYNVCRNNLGNLIHINTIAGYAASALAYNGVRTYVIAVESHIVNVENLQKIANAGGTDIVYDAQDITAFAEQIAEIRKAALGCDFSIPDAPPGEGFVPNKTNFTYTPGGTNTPITLPRADNLEDCGDAPGWYFDNNQNPTKIIVCPASCQTIQNDSEAEVGVAFGCASVAN